MPTPAVLLSLAILASAIGALLVCGLVFRRGFRLEAPDEALDGFVSEVVDVRPPRLTGRLATTFLAAAALLALLGLSVHVISPVGDGSRAAGEVRAMDARLTAQTPLPVGLDVEAKAGYIGPRSRAAQEGCPWSRRLRDDS